MPENYNQPHQLSQSSNAAEDDGEFILPPKAKYEDLLCIIYQLEFAYTHRSQRSLFATPLNIRAVITSILGQFYGNEDTSSNLDRSIFFLEEITGYLECKTWEVFFERVKSYLTT